MNENLILHILTGEATPEEKEEFYRRLENNKEEQELFYEMKSLWLRASIPQNTTKNDSGFNALWKRVQQQKKQISFYAGKKVLRYAAIVAFTLSLGMAAGYYYSQRKFEYPDFGTQKYAATRGSVSIIELADGTKVWLNSNSQLTFREDHKNKQRLAELTGEAYFEVTHCDDFPLLVKAGDLVVRDLGTTFNIKAYPGDHYIETSLVEGEADILTETGKPIVALKPGESAMYFSDDKTMELRSIADNVLSAWRDGKFVIRDQRLEDIFKELSRWYGIEFRFENDHLRDYRFTGNIKKTTTAQHVLKMLKTTTDFNYRIIESIDKPDIVIVF
jgi:ferric-dicitrate binding protein FerR (iron transport regulator)